MGPRVGPKRRQIPSTLGRGWWWCNGRGALRSPALAHILLLSPPMGLPRPYPQGLCRSIRQNKEHCWNVFAETLGSSIWDYLIPTSPCRKGSSKPTLVSLKWKLEHSLAFIFLSQRECELLECPNSLFYDVEFQDLIQLLGYHVLIYVTSRSSLGLLLPHTMQHIVGASYPAQ